MAFIMRADLINSGIWANEFGLDKVQSGVLFGAGIWPFAISIILFSLFIDRVGYKFAMLFSFVCYTIFGALALMAYGTVDAATPETLEVARSSAWLYLYWGSVILGLGNGTVEAFINPVVATLFKDEKSKWLNILHAGWPAGLVCGGILFIVLGNAIQADWRVLIAFMFAPALLYLFILLKAKFPVNERVAAGSSYRDMLGELGIVGALVAFTLIFFQLGQVIPNWPGWLTWALILISVGSFGAYCRKLGDPLLICLVAIMMPVAITELGTDGAISGLMAAPLKEMGWSPTLVLIYTSAIMMVLRFNAGPVIQKMTPLGLLMACSAVAIIGLYLLSFAHGLIFIFTAATIYGVAKSYFWPTMLGIVSEQTPRGGALTLNAIAGIGMLCVGIIGSPIIGYFQESSANVAIADQMPDVHESIVEARDFQLGGYSMAEYTAVSQSKINTLPDSQSKQATKIQEQATQSSLARIAIFPAVMLLSYIALFLFFKSRGGYRPKVIGEAH
jgi:MFS family permease|tara:strand:- start:162 stop:1670 length:1509 start_codon:yes stop_codon:yes gene_type:complete